MSGTRPDGTERDLALVRRCLEGEDAAWRTLLDTHRQRMIQLAARIVDAAEAVDVVDAVIADLWQRRKLARYEGRSTLGTWLGAVAINAALNARRGGERLDPGAVSVVAPVAPANDKRRLEAVLADAIAALPPDSKLLVLMYYEQQLTLDEISGLLGRSKSTLSRTLSKARGFIAAAADRLARERFNVPLSILRADADLAGLDVDLRDACASGRDESQRDVSKR